jgi:hypothetical protein
MEAEKPDNQVGCQSYEQLASRVEWLEKRIATISEIYGKRISALEKENLSLKKQNHAVAAILMSSAEMPPNKKTISTPLPPELSTEKAMMLWNKLIAAGLIDKNFQPHIPNPQAAFVAHIMARELKIRNKWKLFEKLWNKRFLSGSLYRALNHQQSGDFMKDIEILLSDKKT